MEKNINYELIGEKLGVVDLEETLNTVPNDMVNGIINTVTQEINNQNPLNMYENIMNIAVNGGELDRNIVISEDFVTGFTTGFQSIVGNNQTFNAILSSLTANMAGKTLGELPTMFSDVVNNNNVFSTLQEDP